MKFDNFLREAGEWGSFQRRLYVLLALPAVYDAELVMLMVVFLFAIPQHRCAIPGLGNDTFQVQNEDHMNLINQTIPMRSGINGNLIYSTCDLYYNHTPFGNETEECSRWVYDKTVFTSSMSESLQFVCSRKSYVTHGKMLAMIGHLLGALISGPLSDIFGRRSVTLVGMAVSVITSVALTWVDSFSLLVPVVLLINGGFTTMYLANFVYIMEMVGPSVRPMAGVAMNLFWSAGNILLALIAYLIRDWQVRQLAIAVPGVLFIYLYFLPESPRWLLSKDRRQEANKTLKKMLKMNKTDMKASVLDTVEALDETRSEPFWKIMSSCVMARRLCILAYIWFAIGMGFYGLSMNVTNLSGNIYLNYFLFVLLEACAYVICLFLIPRLGRKLMLCVVMLGASIACVLGFMPLLVSNSPKHWVVNILACAGNTCVSAGFAIVFVFTAELLPTTARNFGMGFCSLVSKGGSLLSPYINDLTLHIEGRYSQVLPMLVFGGVVGLAGIITLLLPETKGKRLPETIKDAENIGTDAYDESVERDSVDNGLLTKELHNIVMT